MTASTKSLPDLFQEQGYVVVENLLNPQEVLDPIMKEYEGLLGQLAEKLYADGKIKSTYAELSFKPRLTKIIEETGQTHGQFFDISLPQDGVTEATPIHLGPAVFNLLRHPKLLDVVESLIGPEIYSNPIQHVRVKPPESVLKGKTTATPWHQDNGVMREEADESDVLTVWLPVTDATIENGCMQVVPGSHREGLLEHCLDPVKGPHVPDRRMPGEPVALPMKQGSVLFMHRKTIHGAKPNLSQEMRWSFDLRYNPIGHASGRPILPGFNVRSQAQPQTVLTEPESWARLWKDARRRMAEGNRMAYTRWDPNAVGCA